MNDAQPQYLSASYVEETRFGFWFLRSHTWQHHVLRVAINDLRRLFDKEPPANPVLLDAGCGQGKSFQYLRQVFAPRRLIGLDADPHSLRLSSEEAARQGLQVELIGSDCATLDVADASVDLLFCHQTFHHLVEQEKALAEFYRVLKPGGYLLFAESTEAYIDTWVIRWLFRHPMHVQKSAAQYLEMIRRQGFEFTPRNVSYPYLWWSRAKDFGLLERFGLRRPKPFGQREETLVNVVACKPLHEGAAG
ncbi:class I SAM-dependent methyltransferase [Pseudomonas chlororaphis]|uniref:Methyltransferase domain-containing protein n=1 Tax=Pseudomonas chlororaphis TaxID=587753 RepID=A0AAX3G2R0_9PSED|nr:class I SAM-dependent methyltransferase [Pseudomonas chlororaphis]AZC34890.1 SAM-dependent methyltransferase [Pseudomonas chlororaphis subsp. piscium]AZC41429.1 SAM-dependent methyltransferase [Pseudomonas chlororaphis subsp. piscium]WDG73419.1 class I SAM-dependent methyltransferase [Pseudomonas chlororaphis]WDH28944.1 class I SAM-dependent methyltransferase [Pseudomonas chlororaphis]WDH71941.1 class I SAM-dependent methyltransferase [Pseudomonas chlororaphis]